MRRKKDTNWPFIKCNIFKFGRQVCNLLLRYWGEPCFCDTIKPLFDVWGVIDGMRVTTLNRVNRPHVLPVLAHALRASEGVKPLFSAENGKVGKPSAKRVNLLASAAFLAGSVSLAAQQVQELLSGKPFSLSMLATAFFATGASLLTWQSAADLLARRTKAAQPDETKPDTG